MFKKYIFIKNSLTAKYQDIVEKNHICITEFNLKQWKQYIEKYYNIQ